MKLYLKYLLLLSVFLTGAAVLIVEVVATRILSPYFGNTIFTYSSVIGVVLAALSLGYFVGGRLADRRPSFIWFFGIIMASGVSVFLLQILSLVLLPRLGYQLSITNGPVITAFLMFFLPSALLGTLSPYAIKLVEGLFPKEGIGTLSGLVFFWSTIGSIFGSFFAGFFLIPKFGVQQIIFGVASFLVCLALAGFAVLKSKRKTLGKLLLVTILSALFSLILFSLDRPAGAKFVADGLYEKITIFDGDYSGKPTRFLMQDRSSSGAMYIDSEELVYEYTKYYVLYRVFNPDVKRALAIGGGAYSIPKAILKDIPQSLVDVVEIEPSLFSLAKKYFRVSDNPRLVNQIQDGRRFLHDSDFGYDLIFSDVYYSFYSVPVHFTTLEFFQLVKERLNDRGIFIANFIGNLSNKPSSLLLSEIRTFRKVFPNSYFFAVHTPDFKFSQNIIFVGYNSNNKINLQDSSVVADSDPVISGLHDKEIDVGDFNLEKYALFTDNYAPVEYLTAEMLRREVTIR